MGRDYTKGFTLIELIVYVGLLAVILPLAMSFLVAVLQWEQRSRGRAAIEQEGARVVQIITQIIRNADNIDLPFPAAPYSPSVTLNVLDSTKNQTIIRLNSNSSRIEIKEGAGAYVGISNPNAARVSNAQFYNMTRGGTPGSVRFNFTMTSAQRNASKVFYASASVRPH